MRSSVRDFPAGALRAVLDRDAHRRKLVANRVGARKVACGTCRTARLDQLFDTCCVHVFRTALEPGFRILLQQTEHLATSEQTGLDATQFSDCSVGHRPW